MAVRIRANKTIVCAAMSEEKDEDVYLDDNIHYELAVEFEAMRCIGDGGGSWEFCAPGTRFDVKKPWWKRLWRISK